MISYATSDPLIVDGDRKIVLREFATVPDRSGGGTARLNAVASIGGRLFTVASLDGHIYEITNGEVSLWFDVADALEGMLSTIAFVEGGLRSVAFHPDFTLNGKFYTSQEQLRPIDTSGLVYLSDSETPQGFDSVVTEWTELSPGVFSQPREVMRIGSPGPHTIKQIGFDANADASDPDYGLLFIAHGEGGPNDAPLGGQNSNGLGKVLRINPLLPTMGGGNYTIPPNNPFIGNSTMLDEVYALGFRNPHNLSFAHDGTLFVADIGASNVEEVNLVLPGHNYGWKEREGTYVMLSPIQTGSGIGPLPADDASNGFTYPVAQFLHDPDSSESIAIVGGHPIENGSALDGLYLYGEFAKGADVYYSELPELVSAVTNGEPGLLTQALTYRSLIGFDHDNDPQTEPLPRETLLDVIDDSALYSNTGRADVRFGRGPQGELYITSKQNNTIYQVLNSLPVVLAPDDGAPIIDGMVELSWVGHGFDQWWVYAGSSVGGREFVDTGSLGSTAGVTLNGLPQDGSAVQIRLWYRSGNGTWRYIDRAFSTAATNTPSVISPASGAVLPGSSVDFSWSANGASVVEYWLYVGSTVGGAQYHDSGSLGSNPVLPYNLEALPSDGSTLHVRLWYREQIGGPWLRTDQIYTAAGAGAIPGGAVLIGPSGSGVGNNPSFSWNEVAGASWYYLWIDNPAGTPVKRQWLTRSDAGCDGSICSPATVTNITGNARWWIRTWNSAGYGPWSTGMDFVP